VLPSGERAKNVRSISLPSLQQYYLVAKAMSLDKLKIRYRSIIWNVTVLSRIYYLAMTKYIVKLGHYLCQLLWICCELAACDCVM